MLKAHKLSPQSTRHDGARSSVVITTIAPGNVLLTLFGYNDGEIGEAYYPAMDAAIEQAGFIHVYMDARAQSGISMAELDQTTRWSKRVAKQHRGSHLLFRSKLLELALAMSNLAMRSNNKGYSSVAAFEAAIAANVPGFRRLPTFAAPTVGMRPDTE